MTTAMRHERGLQAPTKGAYSYSPTADHSLGVASHERPSSAHVPADMSPGSADRHSCRSRMIDMGAFGLPPWTRTCCCQARRTAPLALAAGAASHSIAASHSMETGSSRYRSCRAVQRVLVGSVAVPGRGRESAARAALPERRCSGYCSLAAWYCSSVTGSSHVVRLLRGCPRHGEVADEVSGGGAVPVFLAWRGGCFRPGKGQGSATSICLVAVRLPRAVPR
jgi:hypothetical protein